MKTAHYRTIDLEISEMNGPRDIGGMIETARANLDSRVRTILCTDGSGNEAVVLTDAGGVTRVYDTRRAGAQVENEVADAIREGVDPFLLCRDCEAVPLVVGAYYSADILDACGLSWIHRDGTSAWSVASTEGFRRQRFFNEGRYLGPDQQGIGLVAARIDGERESPIDLAAIANAIRGGEWPSDVMPEDETLRVYLTPEEKALLDDGQGWWIESDEVELIWGGGHVTMAVTRREGPFNPPRVYDDGGADQPIRAAGFTWNRVYPDGTHVYWIDAWIDIDELPESIVLRMLDEGGAA